MECNVVKDLIPLYIDDCCSEESAKLVKEHLESCPGCKEYYESISAPCVITPVFSAPKKISKINEWKASILQAVLLFASFAIITVGVALENDTPYGYMNGFWALSLVVPTTGFLLSLANWYFIRLYKSRKSFSNCSMIAAIVITAGAYIWTWSHYEINFFELFSGVRFEEFAKMLPEAAFLYGGLGIALTVVLSVLSRFLSGKYAAMLGKE